MISRNKRGFKGHCFKGIKLCEWQVALLCFVLACLLSSQAWAVGNIHFGLIEINPGFHVKETYNDNVDVDDPDSHGDWITSLSAGVKMKWPLKQHTIESDWLVTKPQYAKYTKWNYTEYRLSARGDFLFGWGGRQFRLDLKHLSLKSSDSPELGEYRRKRKEDQFTPRLKINIKDNIQLDLGYGYRKSRYEDQIDQSDSKDENYYSTALNLKIASKTTVFFSARRGWIDYENHSNNSTSLAIIPGIRWEVTAKLYSQLSAGFQWKDYKDKTQKDTETMLVMFDLTHTLSDFTKVKLNLDIGERDYAFDLWIEDSIRTIYDNYKLYKINISSNHQLTYKVGFNLGMTYEYDNYQKIDRQDKISLLDFGIKYQIQEWLFLDCGFKYKHRSSDGKNPANGYTNKIYSLSLGLAL